MSPPTHSGNLLWLICWRKSWVLSLFVGFTMSCGDATTTPKGAQRSKLTSQIQHPAFLGNGFDSLKMQHKQHKCIEGEVLSVPNIEVIGQFHKVESWEQLKNALNYSVPGAFYLDQDSEVAKFAFRARDSHLTATYIMKTHIGVKKDVLGNPKYQPDYHELSPENFRERCGNEFVSVVVKGGELHVGIKFSFSSRKHKHDFELGGAVKAITGLGAHVKGLSDEVRRNSSMQIFFHQQGGNLSDLNRMMESKDVVQCSLDRFEQCESILEDILDYSIATFAKSVLNGQYQTVGFQTSGYDNREVVYEDPKVIKARNKLLDSLDQHLYDKDIVTILTESGSGRGAVSRELGRIKNQIESNIRSLTESISLSFKDREYFLKNHQYDNLDLHKYEIPAEEEHSRGIWRKEWMPYMVGSALLAGLLLLLRSRFQ